MRHPSVTARPLPAAAAPVAARAGAAWAAILRRGRVAVALGALALAVAACSGGNPGSPPKVSLSVVTANMGNAADEGPFMWKDKVDHFSAAISANGPAPDIISMTESAGWWSCWVPPWRRADDYDMVDRLIWNLETSTGVRYRVAYLVGA